MRIIFLDGSQRKIRFESIKSYEVKDTFIEVIMQDDNIFLFPLANIHEVKIDSRPTEE